MQHQFSVQTMTCGHCVKAVTRAVQQLDPAATVAVDLSAGRVSVESGLPHDQLAKAIRDEGYQVAEV
jgi:copper chaperone